MKNVYKIMLTIIISLLISSILVKSYSKYNYVFKIDAYNLTLDTKKDDINNVNNTEIDNRNLSREYIEENQIRNDIIDTYIVKRYK